MTAAARAVADRNGSGRSGGRRPPGGDARPDGPNRFDTADAFEPMADRTKERTPALLAAKTEPLGGAKPRRDAGGGSGRNPRPSSRPGRDGGGPSRSRNQARKPNDGPKALIGIGIAAVLLIGAGVYFFTRGSDGDDSSLEAIQSEDTAGEGTEGAVSSAPQQTTLEPEAPAATPPVVVFDEAAIGPIQAETEYAVSVSGGPQSAMYRLLVDGEPQAEPAAELPPASFAPGRHLLVIEITSPEGDHSTDPVLVYAVGGIPEPSYRANLSSVNVEEEGWAEAVRQFDEFVAAGHTDLELMPSDWFPSLLPGYWNLFIDGFANADEALAYCAEFELAVPDECFAVHFDPDAPAGG